MSSSNPTSSSKTTSKEFDEVIKPAPNPIANPINPPSQILETGRGKEWDLFLGQVNDNYIKTLREYAPREEFTLDIGGIPKTYTRSRIRTKNYIELEKLRAQFSKATASGDVERASELQFEIYVKCAEHYLGMTLEEFENSDFEEIKKICDACNFRTLHGLPN